MPTFQNYEPQVTPDIGSTPQVRNGAEAIGQGAANLGAGLQEFGKGMSILQARQGQQQRYDTGLSFDNLRQTLANQNADIVRNQQPGAAGLADQGMKAFDTTVTPWFKALPKDLQEEYAPRVQGLRLYYQEKYAGDQYVGRGDYERATNASEVIRDQGSVAANPGAVNHVLDNRMAQIDNMSVPPAEKEILKQQAKRALATSYLDAAHGTDPGGASQVLGVTLPGGPAPGASGYGAINAPYKAPLDQPGEGGHLAPRQMYGFLKANGATDNEALMLTGAAASESSFNPNAVHDGGNGHGLFGHNDHRLDMRGKDWQQQAMGALQELRSRPESAMVNSAQSPEQLAVAEMHFENPRGYTSSNPKAGDNYTGRLNTIRYFSQMTGQEPTGGPAAAGAHPQATAYQEDDQPRFSQPAPLFDVFAPQERQQMLAGVQANAARDRGQVSAAIKDDIASIESTGTQSNLPVQRVVNSLGPDAADAWLQQRQAASTYYGAVKDFPTLTNDDMQQRLASIAPLPGQPGYVMAQNYYAQAQQVAAQTLKQRQTDPAGAVAASVSQPNQPVTPQIAAARMTAQTQLGIPAGLQSPMTYQESQQYLAPLLKALPGQQKQALQQMVQQVQQTYGDQAPAALGYMMGQYHADAAQKAIVGSIMRKIGFGQPVTVDDARQFDDTSKDAAANHAVAGILGPSQGPFPTPDTGAIDMLRQNPGLAPKFDQAYGPGRSAQILQFNAQPGAAPMQAPAAQPGGAIKPPPVPKPTGQTPTSGNDAYQQERQNFNGGTGIGVGDGFGGSGVGM